LRRGSPFSFTWGSLSLRADDAVPAGDRHVQFTLSYRDLKTRPFCLCAFPPASRPGRGPRLDLRTTGTLASPGPGVDGGPPWKNTTACACRLSWKLRPGFLPVFIGAACGPQFDCHPPPGPIQFWSDLLDTPHRVPTFDKFVGPPTAPAASLTFDTPLRYLPTFPLIPAKALKSRQFCLALPEALLGASSSHPGG